MNEIAKAAVIGAGVMGAGIAAQLADAGVAVTLLDLDPALAIAGVMRQQSAGGFADPAAAERIRTGSTVTDLALLAEADWIVESVAERLDVKRQLYAAIDGMRKPSSIVSSNTSTILLSKLTNGAHPSFVQSFLITHFFNPPRRMRLLELVSGSGARPEVMARIADFAERRLGKSVVIAKDTPGFIANRIGNFWMAVALHEAVAQRLDVEEADAVIGEPFGLPLGVFGFADLVGIDLMPPVWRSLQSALPPGDPLQAYAPEPPLIGRLIAQGRTGRKAGAGFMRRRPDRGFDVLDLATGEYRPMQPAASAALESARGDLTALMSHDSPAGRFALGVMGRTLAYAASLVPEIADTPGPVDQAMRDGYGWRQGPFELIERIGAHWLVERLAHLGVAASPLLSKLASEGALRPA